MSISNTNLYLILILVVVERLQSTATHHTVIQLNIRTLLTTIVFTIGVGNVVVKVMLFLLVSIGCQRIVLNAFGRKRLITL